MLGLRERGRGATALAEALEELRTKSEGGDTMVRVAVNYGGRAEIVEAVRRITRELQLEEQEGNDVTALDEDRFGRALSMVWEDNSNISEELNSSQVPSSPSVSLPVVPAPDMLIRTGGEKRLSNFLLWDLAYTELYFSDVLWPDFDDACLDEALAWFFQRKRRYGGRKDITGVENDEHLVEIKETAPFTVVDD